ncbi:hypothetical protein PPRY_a0116 [Pseudoalteromonas prydzensis ACAM 620]|nr:hypothetical protein [Pseudoalteromonas prydzensis ACAM 620]
MNAVNNAKWAGIKGKMDAVFLITGIKKSTLRCFFPTKQQALLAAK